MLYNKYHSMLVILSLHDALPILQPVVAVAALDPVGAAASEQIVGVAETPHDVVADAAEPPRSEEHTSELQSLAYLVCRLLLEKKKYYVLSYSLLNCSSNRSSMGR